MPFTFNGIGTTYAGRKNASARLGTCDFCKRQTTLTSYDTREFFCFIYIPLIPITAYRIFDECASCRKHRRAPLKEFAKTLAADLEPLREGVRRSPQSAQAHEDLIRALAGYSLHAEAEEAARSAVGAIPNDPRLNLLAGQILSVKGDLEGAQAFLKRAAAFDPNDGAARLSLGRVLYLRGDWAGAVVELAEARRHTNDPAASILLAESYEQMERWPDALTIWQQSAGPGAERDLLRRIAFCKEKLGYPLNEVERKAARRWWPFARRRVPKIGAIRPARVGGGTSKIVIYGGGFLLIIMALSLGTMAYVNLTRTDVWFDSARPRVTFTVDGDTFRPDAPPLRKELSFGRHKVVARDKDGKTLDDGTIDVQRAGWFDTLMGNRAYVYNVGAARVYRRTALVYSTSEPRTPPEVTYIAGQSFFPVDHVDYLFQVPPQSIEMSAGSSSETKISFSTASELTLADYATIEFRKGKAAEAVKLLNTALQFDRCDHGARQTLVELLAYENKADESVMVARKGARECDDVLSHRLYQDTMKGSGSLTGLLQEYASLASAHSDSAKYRYLYGRLLTDEAAAAELREAVRLDPNLPWPHAALGYLALGFGRYEEAMAEYGSALELHADDDTIALMYSWAAVAASRPKEAHRLIDPLTRGRMTAALWSARYTLLLGEENWTAAKSLYVARTKDRMTENGWLAGAQLYAAMGDDAALEEHIEKGRKNKDLEAISTIVSIERLVTNGNYAAASAAIETASKDMGAAALLYECYRVAGTMIDGDVSNADARLRELQAVVTRTAELDVDDRLMFANFQTALSRNGDERAVVEAVRRQDLRQLKHVYFFLAAKARLAGDRAHARELFAKSAETAFDVDFPRAAARRLASE